MPCTFWTLCGVIMWYESILGLVHMLKYMQSCTMYTDIELTYYGQAGEGRHMCMPAMLYLHSNALASSLLMH